MKLGTFLPTTLATATLALSLAVTSAQAQTTPQAEVNATLMADDYIWSGLFSVAVADQIRNECARMDARTFRATRFLYDLYGKARDYGYSRDQIDTFRRDEANQELLRTWVMQYFDQHGVRLDAPETFCALGEAEIAAGTRAGTLLRAR
ncbi:DUF5333 domain-containing protein [Pararhodobacter oceanensis]|uniref:DUF5333 domain-containing protein n=1 Tax=Pararhodobacter oceanensis TaxID=2172121 RepID=UPI003A9432E7